MAFNEEGLEVGRRAIAGGVVGVGLFGASWYYSDDGLEPAQPMPDEPPPIEAEYLTDRNAVRLSHTGSEPLTDIAKVHVEVYPRDIETQAMSLSSEASYGATLELDDGTTGVHKWISTESGGISDYPIEPDDSVYVTGYRKSMVDRALESGDEINVFPFYPDEHGWVFYRGFAEVP